MRYTFVNIMICILHIVSVLLIEALLGVTIIWFHDYHYTLNVLLAFFLIGALSFHYFLLWLSKKRNYLKRGTMYTLLSFDILMCVFTFIVWGSIAVLANTMPHFQILFTAALNALLLLSRVVFTICINKPDRAGFC